MTYIVLYVILLVRWVIHSAERGRDNLRKSRKKYVLVESLALARALELQKEAGVSDVYLSESVLTNEEGFAQTVANMGGEVRGPSGDTVWIKLPPAALGLEGEVEGFIEAGMSDSGNDYPYMGKTYLRRSYMFNFNHPKTNKHALYVWVALVKETKESDWSVEVEGAQKVTDGFYGPSTEVVRHEYVSVQA